MELDMTFRKNPERIVRGDLTTAQPSTVQQRVVAGQPACPPDLQKPQGSQTPQELATAAPGWVVTRLVDERSGDCCVGIDFPTRLNGVSFEVIDEDLAEQPGKMRALLKKRGAAFSGSKKKQIEFVASLIKAAKHTPRILAMKPGFREAGFILGTR